MYNCDWYFTSARKIVKNRVIVTLSSDRMKNITAKVVKEGVDRAAANNSIQFIRETDEEAVDWQLEDNTDEMNNF